MGWRMWRWWMLRALIMRMFVFLRFLACVRVGRRFVRVFRFQFFESFMRTYGIRLYTHPLPLPHTND